MTYINQTSTRSRVITHVPLVVVASNGVNKSESSYDVRWLYLNGTTPQCVRGAFKHVLTDKRARLNNDHISNSRFVIMR